ncbi:hypothetical protein [Alysiella crassa]|nr:hypothetical protein [Alysiella crassa]UOP06426.1 hypothetical protein LVJ80_11700 [Alysiella crassa]
MSCTVRRRVRGTHPTEIVSCIERQPEKFFQAETFATPHFLNFFEK